jgi:hypothetical protein
MPIFPGWIATTTSIESHQRFRHGEDRETGANTVKVKLANTDEACTITAQDFSAMGDGVA